MENRCYVQVLPKINNKYREWFFLNWDGKTHTFYLSHKAGSYATGVGWANVIKDLII